ncbi:MAG: branched-chain amino acid ABC transporter permease [Acidimicrobiia bacterium]
MELFLQRTFDGLNNGSVYALVALALVVVYRGTGHLNFAQGEMALMSTYVAWVFADKGFPVVIAIAIAMTFAFLLGAGVERALVRPIAKQSELAVVIVALGLFTALNALTQVFWDPTLTRAFPTPFPNDGSKPLDQRDDFVTIGGAHVFYRQIGVILALAALVVLLWAVFQKTRFGLAMRAVAINSESARLAGIKVSRTLMASWGLSGALGALAGCLIAPSVLLTPQMMFGILIYASAAATLGGFDSPVGAVVGGLIVGLVESLASGYIGWVGSDLKLLTAVIVILAVLLVRPNGLFGSAKVERV